MLQVVQHAVQRHRGRYIDREEGLAHALPAATQGVDPLQHLGNPLPAGLEEHQAQRAVAAAVHHLPEPLQAIGLHLDGYVVLVADVLGIERKIGDTVQTVRLQLRPDPFAGDRWIVVDHRQPEHDLVHHLSLVY